MTETGTLRQVDISAASDEDDVRDALIEAINRAPTLDISATSGGAGLVDLVNNTGGTAGNVAITDTVTDANFTVTGMTGGLATAGERIYGFTQAGSSTEPNSVEVKFYSRAHGEPLSTANAYTWESGHPTTVDVYFAYAQRVDNLDVNAFRRMLVHGIVGDAAMHQGILRLVNAIGIGVNDEDLSAVLTNLTDFFVFSGLPAAPTVVDALNEINEQIGDRDYTGSILSDGQTVTASLQALSDAIGASSLTRVIERLSAAIPKNTAHTLPGSNTYTLDATNNGLNMYVIWRKQWRDPGPNTVQSNDYAETSTTQITPYEQIKEGDSINYLILQ